MHKYLFYLFSPFIILFMFNNSYAQDASPKSAGQNTSSSITDDAKSTKNKTIKSISTTHEAIKQDVKQIKEQVPKDFKKSKDDIVDTSKEVKQNVTQEIKDIHEGLKKTVK